MPFADGILSIKKLTLLCLANSYREIASPSLESIEEEKYFASCIPNLCCGLGLVTDKIAFFLNCPSDLVLLIRIFRPEAEYPNFPEQTIWSPGFAPFLFGMRITSSKTPTILQSIMSSFDLLVSPPTILTPNSLDAFLKPSMRSLISLLEYFVGIPIEMAHIYGGLTPFADRSLMLATILFLAICHGRIPCGTSVLSTSISHLRTSRGVVV